jgi:hypothetical protein
MLNSHAYVAVLGLALLSADDLNAQTQPESGEAAIQWQVSHRFRLLNPEENDRLQLIWSDLERLKGGQRATAQDLLLRLQRERNAGAAMISPEAATGYDRGTGRYTRTYVDLRGQQARVKVWAAKPEGMPCAWRVASPAELRATDAASCSAVLSVPYGESISVTLARGTDADGTTNTVEVKVEDVLLVAFGDSYVSGEGNPDIPAQYGLGTPVSNDWLFRNTKRKHEPAVWLDQECHRSLLSWPVFAALKLAMTDPHRTVTLLDYACSGAEIVDGVMKAQLKSSNHARNRGEQRDGEDPSARSRGVRSVRRSQVNALREDLCADQPLRTDIVKDVPGQGVRALMITCDSPVRKPDFLGLMIGGNDIKFGPTVQGILMPSTARGSPIIRPFRQALLNKVRKIAGVESPAGLGERAQEATSHYPKAIERIAEGAWLRPSQVVLVRYPNPVSDSNDSAGCRGPVAATHHENSFMAFGVVAHKLVPVIPIGWTVEFDGKEIGDFLSAFPMIQTMQKSACASDVRVIDALSSSTSPSFSERLLCSSMTEEQREDLESRYFCQGNECGRPAKPMDGWNPYRPDRRMTYSFNDALLMQRAWRNCAKGSKCNFSEEIKEALAGTMHLTAEMHAATADSVQRAITESPPTLVCN